MARKGSSLLEVLMVLVVLTILASISFGLLRVAESSRINLAQNQVDSLGFQVSKAAGLKGFPPVTLEELAPKVERPDWIKGGKFVDAWDRPIEYRVDGIGDSLDEPGGGVAPEIDGREVVVIVANRHPDDLTRL